MSKPDISEHAAQRPAQTNGAVGSSEVMTTLSFFFSLEGAEALEGWLLIWCTFIVSYHIYFAFAGERGATDVESRVGSARIDVSSRSHLY